MTSDYWTEMADFDAELQQALMNRKLQPELETVFMMPHERYTYIPSRLIKEVPSLGAPIPGMPPNFGAIAFVTAS